MTKRGSVWILCVAAIAGACTMTVELAAVRLIAPWFGTTSGVWTNVIGVVLLALSIGYLVGARLSCQPRPGRALAVTLLLAALFSAWLPALAGPVSRAFFPPGLALDEAADLLRWGSLASALILFMPSALLLGCTPPLASEMLERLTSQGAGSSGGRVLAASTIGSLGGTFATTYLALPVLGLTRTFVVCGSILGLLGVCILWHDGFGSSARARLLIIPILSAWFCARLQSPDLPPGSHLLESAESSYQSSRVVEEGVGADRFRRLQVNEGLDSFQSVWQDSTGLLPEGYYYNLFALPPWWSEHKPIWHVLVLGLGGGTTWRVIEGSLPRDMRLRSIGVEIDPAIVGLGQRWMQLPQGEPTRLVLAGWDARAALRQLGETFDEVILDAYANQMEIPAHLTSVEFFREVRTKLSPGGWLCVNIGSFGLTDPVVEALGITVAESFDQRVLLVRVPFSRNCVLFARESSTPPEPSGSGVNSRDAGVNRLSAAIALPGMVRWFEPDHARVLTDDKNPIERLQRQSIREGSKRLIEQP